MALTLGAQRCLGRMVDLPAGKVRQSQSLFGEAETQCRPGQCPDTSKALPFPRDVLRLWGSAVPHAGGFANHTRSLSAFSQEAPPPLGQRSPALARWLSTLEPQFPHLESQTIVARPRGGG